MEEASESEPEEEEEDERGERPSTSRRRAAAPTRLVVFATPLVRCCWGGRGGRPEVDAGMPADRWCGMALNVKGGGC
jgi:hypothetical protein